MIELLIVIGVVGIVASIAVALFFGSAKKASDANIAHQVAEMRSQAGVYNGLANPVSLPGVVSMVPISSGIPNLFQDDFTTHSLERLVNTLPNGTVVYYASSLSDNAHKWFFAAGTSKGGVCADSSGNFVTKTGNTPKVEEGSVAFTGTNDGQLGFTNLVGNWSCK